MSQPDAVNPASLTVEQAARVLHVAPHVVQEHVAAGLPVDASGRIHLVEYVAWMLQQLNG